MKIVFYILSFVLSVVGCSIQKTENSYEYIFIRIEEASSKYIGHYFKADFIISLDTLNDFINTQNKYDGSIYLSLFNSGALPVTYDFYNANNCCKYGDLAEYYSMLSKENIKNYGTDSVLAKLNDSQMYNTITLYSNDLIYNIKMYGMNLEYCMCYSALERSEIDRDKYKFAYISDITKIVKPDNKEIKQIKNFINAVLDK